MKTIYVLLTCLVIAIAALSLTGCLLFSKTFVIDETLTDLSLSGEGVYYDLVDITDQQLWIDHEEDIQDILTVGFEIWAQNNAGVANKFYGHVVATTSALGSTATKAQVNTGTTRVLEVPMSVTGPTFVPYSDSFGLSTELDVLKDLAEEGTFKFFLYGDNTPIDFTVDSVKVVITFTAG